jgi:hypothetical protein
VEVTAAAVRLAEQDTLEHEVRMRGMKVANRQSRVATFTYPAPFRTAILPMRLFATAQFYRDSAQI